MAGERALSQSTTISPVLNYATDAEPNGRMLGLSLTAWVQILAVTILMVATFRFNLYRLWGKTNPIDGQDSNWQHSVFVPLIGLYYLYIHREELLAAVGQPVRRELSIRVLALVGTVAALSLAGWLYFKSPAEGLWNVDFPTILLGALAAGLGLAAAVPTSGVFGTVVLVEGLVVFAYGIFPGQNDYLKDLGMVITLFGVVTLLGGWAVMRVAWFPIVFLVVALPWPELVYARLAAPLQQLAASAAVGTMRVFGVDAKNYGTRISFLDAEHKPRMLNVAEACAGLKSVMTFLMVAGTVAFLTARPLWERIVMSLSAVPIAIFCNMARVAGQGLLDRYVSHEWSEGFAHQFAGLVMLIPGFLMILFVGWALERMFIEEVDRNKLRSGGGGGAAAKPKRIVVEVPRKASAGEQVMAAVSGAMPVPALAGAVATTEPAAAAAAASAPPAAAARTAVAPVKPAVAAPAAAMPAVGTAAPAKAAVPAARAPVKPVASASTPVVPTPVAKAPAAAAPLRAPAVPPAGLKSGIAKPGVVKPASPAVGITPPPSTLKPSSRPAGAGAPRTPPGVPASGLKPSTLKPSAPKAPPGAPPGAGRGPVTPPGGPSSPAQGGGGS